MDFCCSKRETDIIRGSIKNVQILQGTKCYDRHEAGMFILYQYITLIKLLTSKQGSLLKISFKMVTNVMKSEFAGMDNSSRGLLLLPGTSGIKMVRILPGT
jgi:hypothetical protein